ncbi:MAG TPA: hypothetical protein VJ853_04605, partial [Thermoanaerobaculia bacterium]|nr:hypothetical protein [Thermoanaerobaculia bacterium]
MARAGPVAVAALVFATGILHAQIRNIGAFLQQCPDRDPAYSEIAADFQILHNGGPVSEPQCTEPISAMPISQYTDALIIRQGLRVMYYMDRGHSGHLPWTSGTLYDWMRTKLGGFNIVDGTVGGYCCMLFNGRRFMVLGNADDFNRDFDRNWPGIAGNIDFYAHEARHVDGFPHVSCCGIPNGCDATFDPSNLSPYGIQWWLNRLWLDGTINVGYECLPAADAAAATQWFVLGLNEQYRSRFCTNPPAIVSAPNPAGGS